MLRNSLSYKGVGFQYAPGVEEKGAPFAVTLDGDIE